MTKEATTAGYGAAEASLAELAEMLPGLRANVSHLCKLHAADFGHLPMPEGEPARFTSEVTEAVKALRAWNDHLAAARKRYPM